MKAVEKKINSLIDAISNGQIIDSDLNVVEKHGWRWKILSLVKCVLRPVYTLFGKDPFAHYRIHAVAASVLEFCQAEEKNLSPQLKTRVIKEILTPLGNKTRGKYADEVDRVKKTLQLECLPKGEISRAKELMQKAVNELSHQLHLKLAKDAPDKSLCFSPMSLMPILGMILKGMPEEKKALFLERMGVQDCAEEAVHLAIKEILGEVSSGKGKGYALYYANALTAQEGFPIYSDYINEIRSDYEAAAFPIAADAEGAKNAINRWVFERTNGQISNLVTRQDLEFAGKENSIFAILNALYFEAGWKTAFKKAVDGIFTFAKEGSLPVKMMSLKKARLACYEGDTFRMLEIPYKSSEDERLAHLVFLPNPGQDLIELENRLTPSFIRECRKNSRYKDYNVKMPKICIDKRVDHLLEALVEMGLPLKEELSDVGLRARLFKIIHQAKVAVDEVGTVASAATAALGVVEMYSPGYEPPPPKEFYIDRDYAYFIVNRDAVIFQGNVKDSKAVIR